MAVSISEIKTLINNAVVSDIVKVRDSMSEYENASKQKLKEEIFNILGDVSKEILGHGLTLGDKEDFIIKLIDQGSLEEKFKK